MARNRKFSVSLPQNDIEYLTQVMTKQSLYSITETIRFIITQSRGVDYKSPEYLAEKTKASSLKSNTIKAELRQELDYAKRRLETAVQAFYEEHGYKGLDVARIDLQASEFFEYYKQGVDYSNHMKEISPLKSTITQLIREIKEY